MTNYEEKYLKYKTKYQQLKNDLTPSFDSGSGNEKEKRHLALCEILNFKGSNNFDLSIIRKIYDENVTIIMADGKKIQGLENHINEMRGMYEMAPDIKIIKHVVQFASGDWSAVSQLMQGTFSKPMKYFNNGKEEIIQPTNKKFSMEACSLILWKNDKIIEERIYWNDNYFKEQICGKTTSFC